MFNVWCVYIVCFWLPLQRDRNSINRVSAVRHVIHWGDICRTDGSNMTGLCCLNFIEEDLLLLLGLGVDVSQHSDVREVYPELAQQRGHPAQREWKTKELSGKYRKHLEEMSEIPGAADRDKSTESSWETRDAALNICLMVESLGCGRGVTVACCVWESFPLTTTSKKQKCRKASSVRCGELSAGSSCWATAAVAQPQSILYSPLSPYHSCISV